MTRTTMLLALALLALPVSVQFTAPPAVHAEDKKEGEAAEPTKDEATAAWLAEFSKQIGKQPVAVTVANATRLSNTWNDKEISDEVKAPIPGLLTKLAGNKSSVVAVAAVENLAKLGAEHASKPIMKTLAKTLKAKTPAPDVYTACLKAMGQLADPNAKTVKELTKLLKYKEDDVVCKAARALAGYNQSPGKLRKQLLEEVIKQSEGVYNTAQGNDSNAKRRWNIISSGVMLALNTLSKQAFKNPAEARSWFNDNKKDRKLWK